MQVYIYYQTDYMVRLYYIIYITDYIVRKLFECSLCSLGAFIAAPSYIKHGPT